MDLQLKKNITKSFQLNGLALKSDALKYLSEFTDDKEELLELVSIITNNIDKSTLTGNFVDKVALEKCVLDIKSQNDINSLENEVLKVIDAFNTPLFNYDLAKKQFIKCDSPSRTLHGDAKSKSDLFRRRYLAVLQRMERHQLFTKPVLPNGMDSGDRDVITPLNSLLGNPGKKYVLGTISQIEEGRYHLEDLNKNIPIDIENATFEGLVTENSIVQAYGELIDGVFVADHISLPQFEQREESMRYLAGVGDMFGGRPSEKMLQRLLQYEMDPDMEDNSLVFLSDIWLDSQIVMQKLNVLFYGYNEVPPFAFIFMGNFTEKPLIAGNQYKLKTYFDQLATLIQRYPNLISKSKFIFIPGPTDPTGSLLNILPKFSIPDVFVKNFKNKISNSIFTTNPCRLRYGSQEIVIFRDDIVNRMRRHCIQEIDDGNDITHHVIQNICSNSHLCNLPLEVRPIYWNYDHSLSVYPLPDVLVLGDKYEQYEHNYHGTICFNPSSFSTDFSFLNYYPSKRECHFQRAPDNVEELNLADENEEIIEPMVGEDYNNTSIISNTSDVSMEEDYNNNDDENNNSNDEQQEDEDENNNSNEEDDNNVDDEDFADQDDQDSDNNNDSKYSGIDESGIEGEKESGSGGISNDEDDFEFDFNN